MTDGSHVRIATVDDLPRLRRVMRAAFADYVPALGFAPSPMARDFGPWVKQNFVLALCDARDRLVGVAVTRPRPRYLYVDAIAVAPTHQRGGGGRALMTAVEMLAAELCYDRVHLHTSPLLKAPMRFYARMGYHEIDRSGRGVEARALFEKRITSALDDLLDVGGR